MYDEHYIQINRKYSTISSALISEKQPEYFLNCIMTKK